MISWAPLTTANLQRPCGMSCKDIRMSAPGVYCHHPRNAAQSTGWHDRPTPTAATSTAGEGALTKGHRKAKRGESVSSEKHRSERVGVWETQAELSPLKHPHGSSKSWMWTQCQYTVCLCHQLQASWIQTNKTRRRGASDDEQLSTRLTSRN